MYQKRGSHRSKNRQTADLPQLPRTSLAEVDKSATVEVDKSAILFFPTDFKKIESQTDELGPFTKDSRDTASTIDSDLRSGLSAGSATTDENVWIDCAAEPTLPCIVQKMPDATVDNITALVREKKVKIVELLNEKSSLTCTTIKSVEALDSVQTPTCFSVCFRWAMCSRKKRKRTNKTLRERKKLSSEHRRSSTRSDGGGSDFCAGRQQFNRPGIAYESTAAKLDRTRSSRG